MRFSAVIFSALVCLSISAAPPVAKSNVCRKASAELPSFDEPTASFVHLVEQLVTKGMLKISGVEEMARAPETVNPITFCDDIGEIPAHVYGQAFAASAPVNWDSIRRFLLDTLLPRMRGTGEKRKEAERRTAKLPVPREVQTLPDVVSALANPTSDEHGTSFELAGKSWALVRSKNGLVLVDIATGATTTLAGEPHYQTEEPVFFVHDGLPHLLTVEQIGADQYLCDYDPIRGTARREFPQPGTFPLHKSGLSTAVIDGKPYAVMSYSLSHPARPAEPGIWLTPLAGDAEPIRIDMKGKYVDDPKVGTFGGKTIVVGISSDGEKVHVNDARTGEPMEAISVKSFGQFDMSRGKKDIHFYEANGKPRILIPTKAGFGILDPIAGKKIIEIPVKGSEWSKGFTPLTMGGRQYVLTNTYDKIVLIDLLAQKVVSRVATGGAGGNDAITTHLHPFVHENAQYVSWGSYDGLVYTALIPDGAIVASKKVTGGRKILDMLMPEKSRGTRAVIVPYGEPARIIDLLSGE